MKPLKHKVYNITELAKRVGNYENCYIQFYLYRDNQDTWLYRVMEGVYDDSEKAYTIERSALAIQNIDELIRELENDDLSCWDYETFNDLDEGIKEIIIQGEELLYIN